MSQSVGQTKIIAKGGTEVVPGGRDQEFTLVIGGPVTLISDGQDPEVLSDIPVIRTVEDKGDQVLFAAEESTIRIAYEDFDGNADERAERRAQGVEKPKRKKAPKDGE